MEISAICIGFDHHSLTLPAPLPFPLITHMSPPNARAKSPFVTFATSTLVREPKSVPASPNVAVTPKKRRSNSYSEKQAAIIQVQQSSDLGSALERMGEILKVQDLNAILRHFGKQRRWQDLSQLFDWMLELNKINASSYSSYIKFMGESVNFVKALEIYNSIPDESAKTNVIVCNSVLNCLVKSGKFDSSIKLFHKMKQDGLTPDTVTYSTLLVGCMKVHHGYSRALELVQELEFNGLQMDSVMYGTLLAVCASNNRCEEAESYFSKMKDEGHLPNLFHYSSLLNAYASGGSYKKAEDLVQDMRSSGMVPNKVIMTTLLKVYVRGCLFEKSRIFLAELEALGYAEDEISVKRTMEKKKMGAEVWEEAEM